MDGFCATGFTYETRPTRIWQAKINDKIKNAEKI